MDIELPFDLKEFLKLLNENGVRYLLIGGYAVGDHGYPRAANDMAELENLAYVSPVKRDTPRFSHPGGERTVRTIMDPWLRLRQSLPRNSMSPHLRLK
jgi:hypothetical protein